MRYRIAIFLTIYAISSAPSALAQCAGWTMSSTTPTATIPCDIGINATPNTGGSPQIAGEKFRLQTTNSNGYFAAFRDTSLANEGYANGILLDMQGNSLIRVSSLQVGYSGVPVIQSRGSSMPLYFNLYQAGDVIVGNPSYYTGLRVQSSGDNSFVGRVGIGVTVPVGTLHVLSSNGNNGGDIINEKSNNNDIGYAVKRNQAGGSFNETWYVRMPSSTQSLAFTGAGLDRVTFKNDGTVGIGISSPTALLHVNGTARIAQTLTVDQSIAAATSISAATMSASTSVTAPTLTATTSVTAPSISSSGNISATGNITANGNISATGTITGAVFQDVAEWVPASRPMPAGTVVVLDRSHNNQVMPSAHAYDTAVAGVVSAQPGLLLGAAATSKAMIATTGRVKVYVDATRGSIGIGDLLVTSDEEGTAMKSVPVELAGVRIHRPGTVIGKALEPLPDGKGEILVLLSLQ
jgi:hypothetical protein